MNHYGCTVNIKDVQPVVGSQVNKEMLKYHLGIQSTDFDDDEMSKKKEIAPKSKDFVCEFENCNRGFHNSLALKTHVRQFHN